MNDNQYSCNTNNVYRYIYMVAIPAPAFPSLNSPQRSAGDRLGSNKPAKRLIKVPLAPGHSSLDWARLKSSGKDLRVS
jgi:hypothetical protein